MLPPFFKERVDQQRNIEADQKSPHHARPVFKSEKLGGLFAYWSNPIGRREAQFSAEIEQRALPKIRKADQRLVRHLAHLANGFYVGCAESVLDPGGK